MRRRYFLGIVVILVIFGFFTFYRAEPLRLKISASLSLGVPRDNPNNYNGSCSVFRDNLNFSIPKNPDFSKDTVVLPPQTYFENTNKTIPTSFNLILKLNQTEKVVEIGSLSGVGYYTATAIFYLDGVRKGNYILTINSQVNGAIEKGNEIQMVLTVP